LINVAPCVAIRVPESGTCRTVDQPTENTRVLAASRLSEARLNSEQNVQAKAQKLGSRHSQHVWGGPDYAVSRQRRPRGERPWFRIVVWIADPQRCCEIVLMKVNYSKAVEARLANAASVSGLVELSAK
jgi:hypothetical protein